MSSLQDRQQAHIERQRRLGKAAPLPNIHPFPPAFPQVEVPPEPVAVPHKITHARYLSELRRLRDEISGLLTRVRVALGQEDAPPQKKPATPIIQVVANYYEIPLHDILGQRRGKSYDQPRHVAMYLAKKITGRSFPVLARSFGGRDHTTILHAYQRIEERLKTDILLQADVEDISAMLKGKSHVG